MKRTTYLHRQLSSQSRSFGFFFILCIINYSLSYVFLFLIRFVPIVLWLQFNRNMYKSNPQWYSRCCNIHFPFRFLKELFNRYDSRNYIFSRWNIYSYQLEPLRNSKRMREVFFNLETAYIRNTDGMLGYSLYRRCEKFNSVLSDSRDPSLYCSFWMLYR